MMKVTLFFVGIFFLASIWSGAFNLGTDFLLLLLGAAMVFVAWLEDKKEKQRVRELRSRQLARNLKWNELYQSNRHKKRIY